MKRFIRAVLAYPTIDGKDDGRWAANLIRSQLLPEGEWRYFVPLRRIAQSVSDNGKAGFRSLAHMDLVNDLAGYLAELVWIDDVSLISRTNIDIPAKISKSLNVDTAVLHEAAVGLYRWRKGYSPKPSVIKGSFVDTERFTPWFGEDRRIMAGAPGLGKRR